MIKLKLAETSKTGGQRPKTQVKKTQERRELIAFPLS
jgi:hypothetical protein